MSEQQGYGAVPPPVPVEQRKGCFTWPRFLLGCLVVMVLSCGGVGGLVWYGYHYFMKTVLSEEPMVIEMVTVSPDEAAQVMAKIESLTKRLDEDGVADLVLDGHEINVLVLTGDPKLADSIEGFRLDTEEDRAHVQLSLRVPFEKTTRYFNVDFRGMVSIVDGHVVAVVDEATVGDIVLPEAFKQGVTEQLDMNLRQNPDMRKTLDQIERFEIKDGKAFLRIRKKPSRATSVSEDQTSLAA
jgi:hypothetical protein